MKKSLAILLLCLFTLPVFAKNTILIVGDSLSAGYGMELSKSWVTLLQQRLQEKHFNYDVINVSTSGNTTSNGLAQLTKSLSQYKPQITIIELGGNDALRGLPLMIIQRNLQRMIDDIKSANSKVLVLGVRLPPNYGPAYIEGFQAIFKALADQSGVTVVPLFLNGVDDQAHLMNQDGIHPNDKAQPLLLENVWVALEKLLS